MDLQGKIECLVCPLGHYAPTPGLSACLACPPGSYQDTVGATSCKPCPPGNFQNVPGTKPCCFKTGFSIWMSVGFSVLTLISNFFDQNCSFSFLFLLQARSLVRHVVWVNSPISLAKPCAQNARPVPTRMIRVATFAAPVPSAPLSATLSKPRALLVRWALLRM